MKNSHENRVKFPEEISARVLFIQHGDDKIPVPGFSVPAGGVYVQVDLTNNGDTLHLKVCSKGFHL